MLMNMDWLIFTDRLATGPELGASAKDTSGSGTQGAHAEE
jgi:hypothetical protein